MNTDEIGYLACRVGLSGTYQDKKISRKAARAKLRDDDERQYYDLRLAYYDLLSKSDGCMRRPRKDTPQIRAILAAEKAANQFETDVMSKRALTIATLDPYSYYVYVSKDQRLVMLSVSQDGDISLIDGDDLGANSLTKIDEFGGKDSMGDHQHTLVNVLLGHKLTKNPGYRAAKRISREGL